MRVPARFRRRSSSEGQSVVELALILPLLLILFLAVADLARIYTTMMTVESAVREAADFGAWNSSYWEGDPLDPTSNYAKTVEQMVERGCIAARSLPDYDGPDDACVNPTLTITLTEPDGSPGVNCADETRTVPCRVNVNGAYDFHLLLPLSLSIGDVQLGLPAQLSFERTSIFAISDFDIDAP
jgi:Flp pilus assembly protein TadG